MDPSSPAAETHTNSASDSHETTANESHRGSSSSSDSKGSGVSLNKEEIAAKYAQVVCVGIDSSTLCEQAFNWYLDNLHRHGNYIIFVHSIELPQLYSYQEVYAPPEMWEASVRREANKAKSIEEKFMYKLRFNRVPGRFVIQSAKPGEAIVKVASEYDASMIVVGTRGVGRLRRTIIGSVSSYVMHHAHAPVVVCRVGTMAARHVTDNGHHAASASVPAAMSQPTAHVHYMNLEARARSSPGMRRPSPPPPANRDHNGC